MTLRHFSPFGYHQCEDSEEEDDVFQSVLYLLMNSFVVSYVLHEKFEDTNRVIRSRK
jgi:hypothetical protein